MNKKSTNKGKKAQSARMGVQAYNAKCTTAKDYWNVCEEIVRRRA